MEYRKTFFAIMLFQYQILFVSFAVQLQRLKKKSNNEAYFHMIVNKNLKV